MQRPNVEPEELDNFVPFTLSRACGEKMEPAIFVNDEFAEEEEA